MNKVFLLGNLTKNPELKSTTSGKSVATASIATSKSYKDQSGQKQQVSQFHNLVIWGKQAEIFCQYLEKGKKVLVIGELQTRNYQAQDGSKRYVTEVVVNEFQFLSPPSDSKPKQEQEQVDPYFQGAEYVNKDENEIDVANIPF